MQLACTQKNDLFIIQVPDILLSLRHWLQVLQVSSHQNNLLSAQGGLQVRQAQLAQKCLPPCKPTKIRFDSVASFQSSMSYFYGKGQEGSYCYRINTNKFLINHFAKYASSLNLRVTKNSATTFFFFFFLCTVHCLAIHQYLNYVSSRSFHHLHH